MRVDVSGQVCRLAQIRRVFSLRIQWTATHAVSTLLRISTSRDGNARAIACGVLEDWEVDCMVTLCLGVRFVE